MSTPDEPTGDDSPIAENPFENPDLGPGGDRHPAQHQADDPGKEYPTPDPDAESHPSSGVSGPSVPRQPGTGARQPLRRESEEPLTRHDPLIPGEILYGADDLEINAGKAVTTLRVVNTGDRPIQVGSHFHFAEVNGALDFDRKAAWGQHLNILSGGSVRFEPGADIEIELVPIAGERVVRGLRGLCKGKLDV